MRNIYIAGNWKMNKNFEEADEFLRQLGEKTESFKLKKTEIIVCPPSVFLELATDEACTSEFFVGSQDVSAFSSGAYTGEVSARMLESLDIDYCIVGHSERRQYHKESNKLLCQKVKILQTSNVIPIYCVGETEAQREAEKTESVILNQLNEGLEGIQINDNLLIAYEPVWAIGTGKTATPQMAQDVHKLIRDWLCGKYSKEIAQEVPILYGGSVKPSNIAELLAKADIDGGLIGGAALDIEGFVQMVEIAEKS